MQIRWIETELLAWHRSNPTSSTAGDHSRHRGYHRDGAGRHRSRCEGVSIGPPVRRLARAGATAELQRRQGPAGRHLQDGRPLSAPPARRRRHRRRARYTRRKATTISIWATRLLDRKPARLVTVAVATKWRGSPGRSGRARRIIAQPLPPCEGVKLAVKTALGRRE
jgi:transposase